MRERIETLDDWFARRQEQAALSEASSNRAVVRYFLAHVGPTLFGPALLVTSTLFTSGVGGFALLGCGSVAVFVAAVAGGVVALGRPRQAAAIATLAAAVLVAGVVVALSTPLADGFVGGTGILLGFAGAVLGLVGHEAVRREL